VDHEAAKVSKEDNVGGVGTDLGHRACEEEAVFTAQADAFAGCESEEKIGLLRSE
jgi:hypothetical protein